MRSLVLMCARWVALSTAALLALPGCPADPVVEPPACVAGELNCPCTDTGTCIGALECTQGYCVEGAACTAGTSGCACGANDACDTGLVCTADLCVADTSGDGKLGDACDTSAPCGVHQGAQMECTAGTCQLPVTCPDGALNCACGPVDTCDSGLECKDATCQVAGCTAGTVGCPCGAGDVCDTGLECTSGTCQTPGCTAGTSGCPCIAGGICDAGFECVSDLCQTAIPPDSGVQISNGDVRSCGFVVDMADVSVTFAADVVGKTERRGSRIALAFHATTDAGWTKPIGVFTANANDQPADMSAAAATKVECFDRLGAPITAPGLELQ